MLRVVPHLLVVELPTDQTLEGEDGILRVHNCLSLSRQANKTLAVLGERDDGGSCPCTFRVLDDAGSLALHDGDARVGRAQVNRVHVPRDEGTGKALERVSMRHQMRIYEDIRHSCLSERRLSGGSGRRRTWW